MKATVGNNTSGKILLPAHDPSDFLLLKAYNDPTFSSKYTWIGATKAGIIRRGYHFAQAKFFVKNGGWESFNSLIVQDSTTYLSAGWSPDGRTLPGALDIECNIRQLCPSVPPSLELSRCFVTDGPAGKECHGLSQAAMVSCISDFSATHHAETKSWLVNLPRSNHTPMIYTTTDWWKTWTGNSAKFGTNNPLWIAHYASSIGTVPAGWKYTTFWQNANKGPNSGTRSFSMGMQPD
ncbi:glycoside hydrolase superfamily [Mycena alexandri]|uniref:Glycoside hydrolase superfamily n=1 Tax=Mycena alexandri TaxID=1745969 RepID=A0AAD6SRG7_9AGAR|nr:glycoside hydrolase superfamily [Mycena alexandri]